MTEHPEVIADLWVLYRLDFWEWIWRPRIDLLEQCVRRLALDPHSHWRASMLGGPEWIGWTTEAALLADVVDMTAFVASAAGQNRRARHKQIVPRPTSKRPKRVISTRDDVSSALAGLL